LNLKPRQVIQSIKRLRFYHSFQKYLSEILPSSGLGPGPDKVA